MTSIKHRPVNMHELIAWELPSGQVRWHMFEEAASRISYLAARPGGCEFATKCSKDISIWAADGKFLRSFDNEFLGGPIVFSPDGGQLVAPHGNVLRVRSSESGQAVTNIPISESTYTSATCAAFVHGTMPARGRCQCDQRARKTDGKSPPSGQPAGDGPEVRRRGNDPKADRR